MVYRMFFLGFHENLKKQKTFFKNLGFFNPDAAPSVFDAVDWTS